MLKKQFSLTNVAYLGGYSGDPEPKKGKILVLDKNGISLKTFRRHFTIPWSDVAGIRIDGEHEISGRITATRPVGLGVLAAPSQKQKKSQTAFLVVTTNDGDEVTFMTQRLSPTELRGKVTPVANVSRMQAGVFVR